MFRKQILRVIEHYIRSNYQMVEVNPGQCRYNYQCHSNSVHEATVLGHKEIALVVYFEGNEPTVHFINVDNEGKFVDNTLGVWCEKTEMYLIRKISKMEFYDVYMIHNSFRMHLKNMLPFHLRIFHDHKKI